MKSLGGGRTRHTDITGGGIVHFGFNFAVLRVL